MSRILYFCEMSGFEPKELLYQVGALQLSHPSPYFKRDEKNLFAIAADT
jgi:hypothetical protein